MRMLVGAAQFVGGADVVLSLGVGPDAALSGITDGDLVHVAGKLREPVRDADPIDVCIDGQGLATHLLWSIRAGIEAVHVAEAARQHEIDDMLGLAEAGHLCRVRTIFIAGCCAKRTCSRKERPGGAGQGHHREEITAR